MENNTHNWGGSSRRWKTRNIALNTLSAERVRVLAQCVRLLENTTSQQRWVMSHTTALLLLGIELPRLPRLNVHNGFAKGFDVTKLHVSLSPSQAGYIRTGVSFHIWAHAFVPVSIGGNVQCVPPIVAWVQMAKFLELNELVVLGDSMMRGDRHLRIVELPDFEAFMAQGFRFPGVKKCRAALKLMVENTDSSQETRLRLFLEDAGFSAPQVNYRLYDYEENQNYYFDLAYPEHKLLIEYDGEQHFSDEYQRENDDYKRRRAKELGWKVQVVHAKDLSQPDRQAWLVAQILEAMTS